MKKNILVVILVIMFAFLCIGIVSFYFNSHKNQKANYSFELPSVIEDRIFANINKNSNNNESFLLNNLLTSGKWVEINSLSDIKGKSKFEDSLDEWKISNIDGMKVSIDKPQNIDGYNYGKLNVPDGFFLNITTLEWGGALYFYPNADKNKKYKIKNGYIWELYTMNNENYALASYPFKTPRNGKILKLKKSFGKWIYKEITDIGDIPCTFTFADSNTMYLVTYDKLLKLVNNELKKVVISNAFWEGLVPNSAVYDNGNLFIGMRAGVAKVNLANRKIQFLIPKI